MFLQKVQKLYSHLLLQTQQPSFKLITNCKDIYVYIPHSLTLISFATEIHSAKNKYKNNNIRETFIST